MKKSNKTDALYERAMAASLAQIPRRLDTFREITVGRPQDHGVIPRIVGAGAVRRFKEQAGVCLYEGCHKIAGHGGTHT